MKINIVGGSGIMGQLHKPIFEKAGHEVIISGRNSTPTMEESAKIADLTIISVPIPVTEEIIKRVAKYCKALMDFTSVKVYPIKWMLKYSRRDCEVGGLHPMYGKVESIKERPIIYCPTEREGEYCKQIISALESQGAIIFRMTPEEHDKYVVASQLARIALLRTFGIFLTNGEYKIKELYDISPSTTKILLDILARQLHPDNDKLYIAMKKYNPYAKKLDKQLFNGLSKVFSENQDILKNIRDFFGNELEPAQKRAKRLIELIK
jgi:prephenate dehydrogenase